MGTGMLSHTDRGRGSSVVLLHGIPGSRKTWNDVVPLITGKARILVPDLLGFGSSPDGSGKGHAFEQAEAVLAMLDACEVRDAHLVGFDFGGPVAVALHALAPERINRLTLIATNLLTDTPVPLPLRITRLPVLGELMFRILFSRPGLIALWRSATVDRRSFTLRAFMQSIDRRGNVTSRRIFLASMRRLMQLYGEIEAELPKIEVPVTLVWGGEDPFFSVATGDRSASRIRGAKFIVFSDCGHFVPGEKPLQLAAAILSER